MAVPHRACVGAGCNRLRITSLAVSTLDTHALFALGDLRGKLAQLFQGRFVYVTEQSPEGLYMAEIDTESATGRVKGFRCRHQDACELARHLEQ